MKIIEAGYVILSEISRGGDNGITTHRKNWARML